MPNDEMTKNLDRTCFKTIWSVIPSVSEGSLNLFEISRYAGFIAFAIDSSLFAQNDK